MQGPKPAQPPGGTSSMDGAAAAATQPPSARRPDVSRLLHDLNQPLSAISNYAQAGSHLIATGAADTDRLKSLFDKIVQQSARAAALSQDLRKVHDAQSDKPSS
ncbi:MAG TPA: histidine kinase dimerization/phospho-acceptor domain-containing protein [Pseudomonadales bacterium]